MNDFEALIEDVVQGTFSLLSQDTPLEYLSVNCNLPSMAPSQIQPTSSPSNAPGQGVGQALQESPLLAPSTLPQRISDLVAFLVASSNAPARAVDIKLTTSIEQGLKILSGPEALDFQLLVRKVASRFSDNPSIAHRQSVSVHFSLRPGYSSGYGQHSEPGVEDVTGGDCVLESLKAHLAKRHAKAIGVLRGVGVSLEVGYDLVA